MPQDHLNLYQSRRPREAAKAFTEREMFQWLVSEEVGRQFLATLIKDSKVLAQSMQNHTATALAATVAVRDFVMARVLRPLLRHCPRSFVEMQNEESDEGHATNTN